MTGRSPAAAVEPLKSGYPAWVYDLDAALDHPRERVNLTSRSLTTMGAVATVTEAYDVIARLPNANAISDATYGVQNQYSVADQKSSVSNLEFKLSRLQEAYSTRIKQRPPVALFGTPFISSNRGSGYDWPETRDVYAETGRLLSLYPSRPTGSEIAPWRQIAYGSATVGAAMVAIVGTAGVGAAGLPALVPVIIGIENRAEGAMETNNPGESPTVRPASRGAVAQIDPLEEALPFALLGLALAIGI